MEDVRVRRMSFSRNFLPTIRMGTMILELVLKSRSIRPAIRAMLANLGTTALIFIGAIGLDKKT
jgi:hypothetical protein